MKLSRIILVLLFVTLTGCDGFFKQLGETEYGVKFRKLPPMFGGGVSEDILRPGQLVFLWPWDSVYILDSKKRNIEWGAKGRGNDTTRSDYVETRALDGNEVSLAVEMQYRISTSESQLQSLIQNVGASNEDIEAIVVAAARADIRTAMNRLKTSEFLDNTAKYKGQEEIHTLLQKRLKPFGIVVESVNLKEHRFERTLPDGAVDRSYQDRINQVQTLEEQTVRENLRKNTVVADKKREENNTRAQVNRMVEDARGYKKQAVLRADAYFKAKQNDAKAIEIAGKAEVEGLKVKIKALAGDGGVDILKLELVKQLLKANPRFVLLDRSKGSQSIGVDRIDVNDLLGQIGVIEGLEKKQKKVEEVVKSDEKEE